MKTPLKYLLFLLICTGMIWIAWHAHQDKSGTSDLFAGFDLSAFHLYSLTEPKMVLVAGTDEEYDWSKGYAIKVRNTFKGRTDTLMLAKFDPKSKRLSILSIPRDTRIMMYGRNPEKINALNTFGGPELLKKVVGELLDVKISNYVMVNSAGIEKMIDEVGGLEIEVNKKLRYRDRTDGLNLDLEPGRQTLSGKEVVGFIRFRHDELGDIGRIQRQQAFVQAAKQKLADPTLWAKTPVLIGMMQASIKTDLSQTELLELAVFVKDLPKEGQVFATLPGDFSVPEAPQVEVIYEDAPVASTDQSEEVIPSPSASDSTDQTLNLEEKPKIKRTVIHQAPFISYWIPNKQETKKLVERLFRSPEDTIGFDARQIKVALENTTKNKDLTAALAKRLREEGFPIVDIAQGKNRLVKSNTVIHAQKGNLQEARLLLKSLGLPENTQILSSNAGSPLSDVTIVIGTDLESILIKR